MSLEPKPVTGSGWLYIAMAIPAMMLFGALITATETMGAAAIPVWAITIGGAAVVLRGPVGKAIARRLSGELPNSPGPAELPEELYMELDEMRTRMAELEERQDFSERLLATRTEAPPAP